MACGQAVRRPAGQAAGAAQPVGEVRPGADHEQRVRLRRLNAYHARHPAPAMPQGPTMSDLLLPRRAPSTRRELLARAGMGFGVLALGDLLGIGGALTAGDGASLSSLAPKQPP